MAEAGTIEAAVGAFCFLMVVVFVVLLWLRLTRRRRQQREFLRYDRQVQEQRAQIALRYAPPPPPAYTPPAYPPPPVVREVREVNVREIVRIRCRYCGALNDQTAQFCMSCRAPMG